MNKIMLLALTSIFTSQMALAENAADKRILVFGNSNETGDVIDFQSYSVLLHDQENGPVLCQGLKIDFSRARQEAAAKNQPFDAHIVFTTDTPSDAGLVAEMLPPAPDNDKGDVRSFGSCQVFGVNEPYVFQAAHEGNRGPLYEYFGYPAPSIPFKVFAMDKVDGIIDVVPSEFLANFGVGLAPAAQEEQPMVFKSTDVQSTYDSILKWANEYRTMYVLKNQPCAKAGFDPDLFMATRTGSVPQKPLVIEDLCKASIAPSL